MPNDHPALSLRALNKAQVAHARKLRASWALGIAPLVIAPAVIAAIASAILKAIELLKKDPNLEAINQHLARIETQLAEISLQLTEVLFILHRFPQIIRDELARGRRQAANDEVLAKVRTIGLWFHDWSTASDDRFSVSIAGALVPLQDGLNILMLTGGYTYYNTIALASAYEFALLKLGKNSPSLFRGRAAQYAEFFLKCVSETGTTGTAGTLQDLLLKEQSDVSEMEQADTARPRPMGQDLGEVRDVATETTTRYSQRYRIFDYSLTGGIASSRDISVVNRVENHIPRSPGEGAGGRRPYNNTMQLANTQILVLNEGRPRTIVTQESLISEHISYAEHAQGVLDLTSAITAAKSFAEVMKARQQKKKPKSPANA